jgi:hypothetical protein
MLTIGEILQRAAASFKPIKRKVTAQVYSHYFSLVIAICVTHGAISGHANRFYTVLSNSIERIQ